MLINTLDPDAFKLLYLWIYQANGQSSTLAELMDLAQMTLHKAVKATSHLAQHGLANVYGHLAHAPAELTPHAFNLFPLPGEAFPLPGETFDASPVTPETKLAPDTLGNMPSHVLVEAPEEMPQNLQKKFFFETAESLRVVVVNNKNLNTDSNQQQQLGTPEKIFSGDDGRPWPIPEICAASAIKPRRYPGEAYQKNFIAWLIYGYQFKAATQEDKGIISPAHFALANLTTPPAPLYLELAQAGPVALLEAMDDLLAHTIWNDILLPAKRNGLYTLLDPHFPLEEE